MIELARRVVLLACILAGVWLSYLADLSPQYALRVPRQPEAQEPHGPDSLIAMASEGKAGERLRVSGPAWRAFLEKAAAVSRGEDQDPAWLRRVQPFEWTWSLPREVFFRQTETPLDALAGKTITDWTELGMTEGDGPVLEIEEKHADDGAFSLGSGLAAYAPPPAMVFIWRGPARVVWAAGVLFYVLAGFTLPRRDGLAYARWRIVLGDCASVLLAGFFFWLPLAIVGGSMQALTRYGVFPAALWPLSGLGCLGAYFTAQSAALRLRIGAEAISLGGLGKTLDIPYSGIARAAWADLRQPGWLTNLTWLAAASSKGRARLTGAGMALVASSPQSRGLALDLAGGRTAYVWLSDAQGSEAIAGARDLEKALVAARVPFEPTPRELRRLFPPRLEAEGRHVRVWPAWAIGLGIFFGPALLALLVAR